MIEKILAILGARFIKAQEMARVLALAITGSRNVIVYGPAGHGKSEMVQAVVQGLNLDAFTQFCGEGMDESRLYGGLDFGKLETEKVLEYHPARSFLEHDVSVFEEIFDAPASVLLALKDTLTARQMRNGEQTYPMKCRVVIGLTNKEPKEISELGPSAQALIERFPLQLRLAWDSYESSDFQELFAKTHPHVGQDFRGVLSGLIAQAIEEGGGVVSPRTAAHAMSVCLDAMALRGGTEPSVEDLQNLRYVGGFESLIGKIKEEAEKASSLVVAIREFSLLSSETLTLVNVSATAETPIKALQACKRLQGIQDRLGQFRCPDGLVKERDHLRFRLVESISKAQQRALEVTRV